MNERTRRIKLFKKVSKYPEEKITKGVIRKLGIYKGASGICRDESKVFTLSVLNTGKHYPDELQEDALIYHYPVTERPGDTDLNEIEATKECMKSEMPIFVILPGKKYNLRKLKLGWVIDFNDKEKLFLISFDKSKNEVPKKEDKFVGVDKNRKSGKSKSKTRPGQAKFRFNLMKKYGYKCAVCRIENENLLEASHIIPVENKGSDDWRNGIFLCKNHHIAFDKSLFKVNPSNFKIENISDRSLSIIEKNIKTKSGLLPHKDALRWRLQNIYSKKNDILPT